MKIIKKIEVSKFRSIYSIDIDADEINIFSGRNNQGKSNILKALNLFFNSKSNFDQDFDQGKDFNIAYTGRAGGKR
jgi:predicted ATP-dependent endonuclease of OLD family